MKIPVGKESPKEYIYAPERRVKWTRKESTYKCVVCGKLLIWVWRNDELWDAPRYACRRDKCQRIFQHKAQGPEEIHLNRPAFAGY